MLKPPKTSGESPINLDNQSLAPRRILSTHVLSMQLSQSPKDLTVLVTGVAASTSNIETSFDFRRYIFSAGAYLSFVLIVGCDEFCGVRSVAPCGGGVYCKYVK